MVWGLGFWGLEYGGFGFGYSPPTLVYALLRRFILHEAMLLSILLVIIPWSPSWKRDKWCRDTPTELGKQEYVGAGI